MESLPPSSDQLDFPPVGEYNAFFSSLSSPSSSKEVKHISHAETPVSPSDPSQIASTSIQTETPNDSFPKVPGQRLSLPSVPKSSSSSHKSLLLGEQLQTLLKTSLEKLETIKTPSLTRLSYFDHPTDIHPAAPSSTPAPLSSAPLSPAPFSPAPLSPTSQQTRSLKRGSLLLLMMLVGILLFHTFSEATSQLTGSQGWAYVLGGPVNASDPNLLTKLNQQLHHTKGPGTNNQPVSTLTPQQYVDMIVANMSLNQKLGQMMIVQFVGSQFSLALSTMITQYNVGSVLVFKSNSNIQNADQLKSLIQQMQASSKPLPLSIAIDQEGGAVDRLVDLDGPRPSEASIGATGDPTKAKDAGLQDAQDLSSYGFNLNLAPVVDVTRVYNPQLATRTYGNDPALVTQMAAAYLQGLQQSGKVLGTIKHFPGLGDVAVDPHLGVPLLRASKDELEQVDWAPYRSLIQQNLVHVVMVTHEIVGDIDPTVPSTLSSKVVTGILRNDLGFQGVIMTDSLSMDSVASYASEPQAAAEAIVAGADIVMGAASPEDVAAMFTSIKQAISNGSLTTSRIDDSVRRILLMKYSMGLLSLPSAAPTTK